MVAQAAWPSVLDAIDDAALDEYLGLWGSIDVERQRALTRLMLRDTRVATELGDRWATSLAAGHPDFGIYDDDDYISELWLCWRTYSRGYLRSLVARLDLVPGVTSAVDLGCGFGYTTLALREAFPAARIYATNVGAAQSAVARSLGIDVRPGVDERVDLVFASEYFEHFERPINHLDDVLEVARPRYVVAASTFTQDAPGHFTAYRDRDGEVIPRKSTSRVFNAVLRGRGYRAVETRFWNGRPAVWAHSE